MGEQKKSDAGVVSRLAGRGEDAVTRLMDEVGRNRRVTDALSRAMAAKGKLDDTTRKAVSQMGLAPGDELKELRAQVDRLEKRVAKLERTGSASAARSRAGRRATTTTKSSGASRGATGASGTGSGSTRTQARTGGGSSGGSAGSTPSS